MRLPACVLGVVAASLLAPVVGTAAKIGPIPPLAALMPRPGDLTLEAISIRLTGRDSGLTLHWIDPRKAAKQAEALSFVKTSKTAMATTFRVFVAIANWNLPSVKPSAGAFASVAPVSQHLCSSRPLTFAGSAEALLVVDEPLPVSVDGWGPCPSSGAPGGMSEIDLSILRDVGAAKPSDLAAFAREAKLDFGNSISTNAAPIDTGHYDDGHSFGWKLSTEPPAKLNLESGAALAQTAVALVGAVIAPVPAATAGTTTTTTRQPLRPNQTQVEAFVKTLTNVIAEERRPLQGTAQADMAAVNAGFEKNLAYPLFQAGLSLADLVQNWERWTGTAGAAEPDDVVHFLRSAEYWDDAAILHIQKAGQEQDPGPLDDAEKFIRRAIVQKQRSLAAAKAVLATATASTGITTKIGPVTVSGG